MTVVLEPVRIVINNDVVTARLNDLEVFSGEDFTPEVKALITRRLTFVATQLAIGEFVGYVRSLDATDPSFDLSRNLMKVVNKRWGQFLYEDSSCSDPRSGLKKFLEGMIHCQALCEPSMLFALPDETLLEYKKLAEKLIENFKLLS